VFGSLSAHHVVMGERGKATETGQRPRTTPTHPPTREPDPHAAEPGQNPPETGANPAGRRHPQRTEDDPGTPPGARTKRARHQEGGKRERERERKNPPTHPGARRRDGRDPPLGRHGPRGPAGGTQAPTFAHEGLRPAGGRSGGQRATGGVGAERRGEACKGRLSLVGLGLSANSTSRRCVQSVFARFRAVDAIVRAGFSVDREASNGRCVVRRAADVIAVCVVCGAVERSANLNGPEIAE
jgi:hypothetical protein